jgi:high affinity sulfate transporter 1
MTGDAGAPVMMAKFLPGLAVLRHYQGAWLRPDLIAGLTVGAMLIPQSMGYAELAGMPPQYGFYAVIAPLIVYAFVGSSRHLGVGPEPGTAILAGTGVAAIAHGDPSRYLVLMAALALVVATVCLVGAVLRLGYLASMLAKPVLVGYITGVGLTLVSSQFAGLTGVSISADSLIPRCWQLLTGVEQIHWPTLGLGTATLAVMLGIKRAAHNAPAALIGVVLATVVVAVFSLDLHGVALIGAIPAGLPLPGIPDVGIHDLTQLLPVAAGIALVGFSDNVLTARAIAVDKGYRVDPNQELLALGLINVAAGVSGGFPISSSASRTAVPASLGSRSQLVSLVGAAFVVMTILAARPVLSEIPRAALAAVIVTAAITIIDIAGFRSLWRISREECLLAVVAVIGVVVLGVLYGIVTAVAMSIALALARIAHPHDAVLGDLPADDGWVDIAEYPTAVTTAGLLVFRFDAPLIFINTDRFHERIQQILTDANGPVEWLLLDCEGIGALDASGIDCLRDLTKPDAPNRPSVIAIARANHHVLDRIQRAGLLDPPGSVRSFRTINSAVRTFRDR